MAQTTVDDGTSVAAPATTTEPATTPTDNVAPAALMLVFIAALAFLSVSSQTPPGAVGADAPASEFSSARAMRHLEAISQRPHPSGSAEHAKVREYILNQLTAAGATAEVQRANVLNAPAGGPVEAGTMQNVLGRLAGTGGRKAVLLVGHYDSAPTSLGASDDGSAVAAMLETLRALKAGPPLKNDVMFLFSDGEEAGLMGAEAFLNEHPQAKDVGLVLNFEARGNGGPALLFETSDGNGRLIEEFARAAPKPNASSLFYEVYRNLPNSTDLTIFKDAGYPGLNFAYIGGHAHYHTLSDNLANIDPRSLQHQGSYALSLARHFGNTELDDLGGGNAVYFSLLDVALVHYPAALALPLAVLVSVLFVAVLVVGLRRRALSVGGLAVGFGTLLLTAFISAVVLNVGWMVVGMLHGEYGLILQGVTYGDGLYAAGFAALTVAVSTALYGLLGKRVRPLNLLGGGLLAWVILMLLTSLFVPGASYLFTWPLLFTLACLGFLVWRPREVSSPATLLVLCLCAIPVFVILLPVLSILFVALPPGMWLPVVVILALLLGLLVPQLNLLSAPKRWLVPGAALAAGVVLIMAAGLTSGFDGRHPRPYNLFYALNADAGKSVWVSSDAQPDEWTSQFFAQGGERGAVADYVDSSYEGFTHAPAPVVPLDPPSITLLSDDTQGGVRTLRMRIMSARQAPFFSLTAPAETEVVGVSVNGKRVASGEAPPPPPDGRKARWQLLYYAPPGEGVEVALETKPSQPVKLTLVDQSFELPPAAAGSYKERPADMMPTPYPFNPFGDATLVKKSYTF